MNRKCLAGKHSSPDIKCHAGRAGRHPLIRRSAVQFPDSWARYLAPIAVPLVCEWGIPYDGQFGTLCDSPHYPCVHGWMWPVVWSALSGQRTRKVTYNCRQFTILASFLWNQAILWTVFVCSSFLQKKGLNKWLVHVKANDFDGLSQLEALFKSHPYSYNNNYSNNGWQAHDLCLSGVLFDQRDTNDKTTILKTTPQTSNCPGDILKYIKNQPGFSLSSLMSRWTSSISTL